jgi:hypothetical protein
MNKNIKGTIVVGIVIALGYLVYKKFGKPDSRKVLINYLNATFGADSKHTDFINNAEKGYVESWSNALMNGKDTFEYNGKTYNTKGGIVKK